jgi:hypothetical protein
MLDDDMKTMRSRWQMQARLSQTAIACQRIIAWFLSRTGYFHSPVSAGVELLDGTESGGIKRIC